MSVKIIMKNKKMIYPKLPDGCIGYWDFTLQTNSDENKTMTPDLSGNENHMYHYNMLYDEVKLERLQNSTLHSEVVSKNSKGYHVYKYTPKTRTSDGVLFYELVPKKTLKDKQTISATIYMKYQGNADKLKPSIRIYKFEDENGENVDLSGMITMDETTEPDSEGFYKVDVSYTNNTGADITNVAILIYCANNSTSYLEDGHKPVTYFYIDNISDGSTALRSGFFPQNSGGGHRLEYDGIDDISVLPNEIKNLETYTVVKDNIITSNKSDIAYIDNKKVGRNYLHSNFVFAKNNPVVTDFDVLKIDDRTYVYTTADSNASNNFAAYFHLIYNNSLRHSYISKELLGKENILISYTAEINQDARNVKVTNTGETLRSINFEKDKPIKIIHRPTIDESGHITIGLITFRLPEKCVVKISDCKVEVGTEPTDYIPSPESLLQDIKKGTVKRLQVYNHNRVEEIYNKLK